MTDTLTHSTPLRRPYRTSPIVMTKQLNVCPHCGMISPLIRSLKVDMNANTITFEGETTKATPRVVALTVTLAEGYPKALNHGQIGKRVYGLQMLKLRDPSNSIRKLIRDARPILHQLGLNIEAVSQGHMTQSSYGYRLVTFAHD